MKRWLVCICSVYVTVTGKPCNPRNNVQEVHCSFSMKCSLRGTTKGEQCIFDIFKRKSL